MDVLCSHHTPHLSCVLFTNVTTDSQDMEEAPTEEPQNLEVDTREWEVTETEPVEVPAELADIAPVEELTGVTNIRSKLREVLCNFEQMVCLVQLLVPNARNIGSARQLTYLWEHLRWFRYQAGVVLPPCYVV